MSRLWSVSPPKFNFGASAFVAAEIEWLVTEPLGGHPSRAIANLGREPNGCKEGAYWL